MNIFVGNLSYHIREDELAQLFQQYGEVESAKIIKDRETGRSKGFAFISMLNDSEASTAVEQLNGFEVNGRPMRVSEAIEKPREERREFRPRRY